VGGRERARGRDATSRRGRWPGVADLAGPRKQRFHYRAAERAERCDRVHKERSTAKEKNRGCDCGGAAGGAEKRGE